jgi:VWFA-related protein
VFQRAMRFPPLRPVCLHGAALLAALVALCLAPGAGQAREKNNPLAERSRFFGTLDVSVVNLDVVVTDLDGKPVDGLTRDHFTLLVDGEPVEILNFFAGSESLARPEPPAGAPDLGAEPAPVPAAQRLWLVVYIDSTSIRGSDRNRVITQLKQLLRENLGQEDRVMVVAQSTSQVIRHQFGDPPDRAFEALDEIADEVGGVGQYEAARVSILNTMARGRAGRAQMNPNLGRGSALQRDTRLAEAESVLNDIYSWAQWRRAGLRASASQMEALLDALSGLKGRKALLYVGEGTPYRIGQTLFQAWVDRYQPMISSLTRPPTNLLTLNPASEANRYSVQREYTQLAATAAASRVTYYAIDASRSTSALGISAELSGGAGTAINESARWTAQQESLQRLVGTTGGRYIADLERVDEVVHGLREDFTRYYSLGFAPPGEADGEARNIEVVLDDPKLRVRHRSSFRAKDLNERMAEQLYAALYLGITPNPLAVELDVVNTEAETKKNQYRVRLLARIPLSNLLLVPQADELLGRATTWLAVADAKGGLSDVHGRRLPIRVQQKDLAGAMDQYIGYTMDVVVGKGQQTIALVIRDELAVVSSTITLEMVDGRSAGTSG